MALGRMTTSGLCVCASAVLVVLLLVDNVCARSNEWDNLVFTQDWPPGIRIDAEESGHKFNISKEVKGWTIHGLWPSLGASENPQNCNNSWHFNYSQIANLTQQLDATWPNLFGDTPKYDFWEHEWQKHGTCATSLPATGNEYLYFSKGLQLADRFNLLRFLGSVGIVPDFEEQYQTETIYNALLKLTQNKKVIMECISDKTKKNYLYAVELCFNKSFELIDCEIRLFRSNPYIRDCSKHYEITYAPITYTV